MWVCATERGGGVVIKRGPACLRSVLNERPMRTGGVCKRVVILSVRLPYGVTPG